jgi:hypothetical protein
LCLISLHSVLVLVVFKSFRLFFPCLLPRKNTEIGCKNTLF